MSDRELTQLGRLLEGARTEVLHISTREAARRTAGVITEGRWRQVVSGLQPRAGRQVSFKPKPSVVVAMALAVQVDPAEALRAAGATPTPEMIAALVEEVQRPKVTVPPADEEELIAEIRRIENLPLSAGTRIKMINTLTRLYEEQAHNTANTA